jgi:hypothetical protein
VAAAEAVAVVVAVVVVVAADVVEASSVTVDEVEEVVVVDEAVVVAAVVAVAVAVVVAVVVLVERANRWSSNLIVIQACSSLQAKMMFSVLATWSLANLCTVKSVSQLMVQMREKKLNTACGTLSAPNWQLPFLVALSPSTWALALRCFT